MSRNVTILLLAVAAGCKVGPDYEQPEAKVPPAFLEAGAEERTPRPADWWEQLDDPTLAGLIRDAVAANYDLRIAAARVDEVKALRRIARSSLFPPVDVVGAASRQRDSENSNFGSGWYNRFELGLESSWEVDVWGRVRREVEAATADLAAAEALRDDVRRVVIAQVASEYVDLRGAERELGVARRNLEAQRGTVELTETLSREGLGQDADVARARGLLRETESFVPLLEGRVAGGAHRLAVLTAGSAADIKARLAAATELPETPPSPELGIPSDLLRSRPDIRAAERELAAATARIGVATADLYPRITLFGRFGVDSTEADTLFDSGSMSFGFGPAVRWPLLDYGRVRAQIEAQGARQRAALAAYERTVAQAVTEVETSLALLRSRGSSRERLAAALAHDQEALRLVETRFREGATSFLDVLDAQRRVLVVEAGLARTQTELLLDFVALNRALG
jgi:NodT family efflux transporter outer membrane factor (OMF) lipoprotein